MGRTLCKTLKTVSLHASPLRPWTTVRLDDFCATSSGGTPSRDNPAYYENGTIPWVKSGELSQKIVTETGEKITAEALANSSAKMVKKGAILVAMYGATVGQIAVLGIAAATNQAVCAIEPDQTKCLPRFLYYSLTQKVPELLQMRVGGAQPNISQKLIRDLKFDLPTDLREQARIVELLDQADALRRQRAEADAKLARLLPALFCHHFGDPDTNPHGWPLATVGDVLIETSYGLSLSASAEPKGTPFLRMNNIRFDGALDLEELKYVELSPEDLAKNQLRDGDLLFNRTNSVDLVGKTGLWRGAFPAVAASYLIILRVDNSQVAPGFVWAWMNTPSFKSLLLNRGRRAIGMANINSTELRSFPLFLPSLEKQRRFLAALEAVEAAKTQAAASAAKLETLFQTLLHRAFTGELTARWREAHLREGVQKSSRAVLRPSP